MVSSSSSSSSLDARALDTHPERARVFRVIVLVVEEEVVVVIVVW